MRLAILFDHLGPYHLARLRTTALQHEMLAVEIRGRSLEYAWNSSVEEEAFQRITLFSGDPARRETLRDLRLRLTAALDGFAPEIVAVPGWSSSDAFLTMAWCCEHEVPVVVMSESTAHDETRSPWREAVKRRYLALASSALVGGIPHLAYLTRLGMPGDRLFTGYDVVDNAYFAREAAKWRSGPEAAPHYFLASARFIPKKNLHRLLEAYARYAAPKSEIKNPNSEIPDAWSLCLLGDGELKGHLLAHANRLGLRISECAPWELEPKYGTTSDPQTVYLPGFRQIEELPRFYAGAGAFVHASTTEQWGLVVNEAMACELPVLVSNRCGCAADLVLDGENGWTFDPHDTDALAELMNQIAALPEGKRKKLGAASERFIANWGPERFASGLHDAANCAVTVGPKRAGWLDRLLLTALARR
jgi:glycosyltransferase involved in cell wall biosynthesis